MTDGWGYFEFELSYVRERTEGRITELTTGVIGCSGYDLSDRFFPLTLAIKVISESYNDYSNRLHQECNSVNLNYPDIHRWLVAHWVETCQYKRTTDEADRKYYSKRYKEVSDFVTEVKEACNQVANKTVNGVRLVR